MDESCIFPAAALIGMGATLLWVSAQWMRRGARLHTWVTAEMIAGAGVVFLGFLPLVLARAEVLEDVGIAAWELSVVLGSFAVVAMAAASFFLPDTWLIGDVPEDDLLPVLEKALAQAELDPERTLTGLRFADGVLVRLYYWRAGMRCLLEWHPRGSAARYAPFEARLRELLARIDCPESRRRARAARVVGLLALAAGGWIFGCAGR